MSHHCPIEEEAVELCLIHPIEYLMRIRKTERSKLFVGTAAHTTRTQTVLLERDFEWAIDASLKSKHKTQRLPHLSIHILRLCGITIPWASNKIGCLISCNFIDECWTNNVISRCFTWYVFREHCLSKRSHPVCAHGRREGGPSGWEEDIFLLERAASDKLFRLHGMQGPIKWENSAWLQLKMEIQLGVTVLILQKKLQLHGDGIKPVKGARNLSILWIKELWPLPRWILLKKVKNLQAFKFQPDEKIRTGWTLAHYQPFRLMNFYREYLTGNI